MARPRLIMTALVAALCGFGCATAETQGGGGYEEKVYVTGSRIPVKDKDAVKPADQREIDDFLRQRQTGPARGGLGN